MLIILQGDPITITDELRNEVCIIQRCLKLFKKEDKFA